MDGQIYYVQTTADGPTFFIITDDQMTPADVPALIGPDGEILTPVRTGSAVWFPQTAEDGSILWTRWVNGTQQIYSGDPRQA